MRIRKASTTFFLVFSAYSHPLPGQTESVKGPTKERFEGINDLEPESPIDPSMVQLERFTSRTPSPGTSLIKNLVTNGNLVFHGKVIKKYFVPSASNSEIGPRTLTFVEFQVIDVIKGKIEGDKFTLRHLGGQISENEYSVPTHVHHFNIGDQEIISVKGNGFAIDPVVSRLRVFDDKLYGENGRALIEDRFGNILKSEEKMSAKTIHTISIGRFEHSSANNISEDNGDTSLTATTCKKDVSKKCRHLDVGRAVELARLEKKKENKFAEDEISAIKEFHNNFKK